MKFQLVSDLHLEKYDKLPSFNKLIEPKAPNLILAGDICFVKHPNFKPFFQELSKHFIQIFFVPGNHEYYDTQYHYNSLAEIELIIKDKLSHLSNIIVLQKKFKNLGSNIVIIGATLWSYLSQKDMIEPMKLLTETNFILYKKKLMLHPNITNDVHLKHKQWLNDTLDSLKGKRIIVVTHYLPSKRCIARKYKYDTFIKSYYSNCDHLVKKATIWCAGHTHIPMKKILGKVPVYINSCGYLWETNHYKKDFVFEV